MRLVNDPHPLSQAFQMQQLISPGRFDRQERRIRIALVVQAQVVACPIVEVVQDLAKADSGLLVGWLQR